MKPLRQSQLFSWFIAAVILLSGAGPASFAENSDQPKPGPEQKKLELGVGEWAYEGEAQPTPFADAGKFVGKETGRMILNGFFLEYRWQDTSETGYIAEGVVLLWYDPIAQTYRNSSYENDGKASQGVSTLEGRTLTSLVTRVKDGKPYSVKTSSTFSPDGKSRKGKAEYSVDEGRTWKLMWEFTAKKVS